MISMGKDLIKLFQMNQAMKRLTETRYKQNFYSSINSYHIFDAKYELIPVYLKSLVNVIFDKFLLKKKINSFSFSPNNFLNSKNIIPSYFNSQKNDNNSFHTEDSSVLVVAFESCESETSESTL
jgi:hypothetical protein